jgi:RimJ/RimL family protein N-acetyltransferase
MGPYPKTVSLKNGAAVTLRPLVAGDLAALHQFYLHLPEEDRLYLRADVRALSIVKMQMEDSDAEERTRFVATLGDRIVGQAALLRPQYGWAQHTGELRCVVAREQQDQGLARILLRELFQEATRQGVEILFAKVAAEQTAAIRIMEGLGFQREVVRRDHQRTLHGDLHDVLVMTCSISDAWDRLEDMMHAMDGQGQEYYPGGRGEG